MTPEIAAPAARKLIKRQRALEQLNNMILDVHAGGSAKNLIAQALWLHGELGRANETIETFKDVLSIHHREGARRDEEILHWRSRAEIAEQALNPRDQG